METTSRRRAAALASAVTILALAGATAALATAPQGREVATPLARGPLVQPARINDAVGNGHVSIQTEGALDALTLKNTLAPGAASGWHKHAGPHVTIVTQGTLTIIDATCKRHDLPAGHASIGSAESVDKAENLGSRPVVFYVTFLLPHAIKSPRIDEPAPAGCKA